MVYNLDWQLRIDGRPIKGGAFLAVIFCELIGNSFHIKLLDESGVIASFRVYSSVNIGGKDYLFLGQDSMDPTATGDGLTASTATDEPLTVVRLFDKTRICAMDSDRFSSLRNAFLTFLEMGETSSLTTLKSLLNKDGQPTS